MKFIPRQDYVIIKMEAPKEQTKGGILLPESAKEDSTTGSIVAVGPGRLTDFGHMVTVEDLKEGDRIIFNKYTALELNEDERLYMVRGGEIACKIEK